MVLFAGIGMQHEGHQAFLYNEYDRHAGFFKKYALEKKMRCWSEIYNNAYVISIFSCNRDIYKPEKHDFTCTDNIQEHKLQEIELKKKSIKAKINKLTQE